MRWQVEDNDPTNSNFAPQITRGVSPFSQLTHFARALYFSRILELLFSLPYQPQLTLLSDRVILRVFERFDL
jgi:hypothetical protein